MASLSTSISSSPASHRPLLHSILSRPKPIVVIRPKFGKQQKRSPRVGVRCSSSSSLYAVLGVERDVSVSAIKSAYRQMALRFHPDTCVLSEAEKCTEGFLQVQEAYEVLSDPERRADYDYSLLHPFCAQALGKGFPSNSAMSRRKTRSTGRSEASCAWKLQWEAQVNRMKERQHSASGSGSKTWGAQMRSRNRQEAASVY